MSGRVDVDALEVLLIDAARARRSMTYAEVLAHFGIRITPRRVFALCRDLGVVCGRNRARVASVIDLDSDPDTHTGPIRVYSGYSGWDANQLEDEVASGAWYIVAATPDDPYRNQESMWRDVLRRQPGLLSVVSTYTEDATLN